MEMGTSDTVFDPIRRIRVRRTPEEEVRQAMVYYLTHRLGYPAELMANEASITVGKVRRRCDTVVFSPADRTPLLILEYKAPGVAIDESTMQQALEYNSALGAKAVVLTNGKALSVLRLPSPGQPARYLPAIPSFEALADASF